MQVDILLIPRSGRYCSGLFISIWEKKNLSVTSETFLPYAYRSIKNSCINYYKAEIIKEDFLTTLTEEWKDQLNEEEDFIYQRSTTGTTKLRKNVGKYFY